MASLQRQCNTLQQLSTLEPAPVLSYLTLHPIDCAIISNLLEMMLPFAMQVGKQFHYLASSFSLSNFRWVFKTSSSLSSKTCDRRHSGFRLLRLTRRRHKTSTQYRQNGRWIHRPKIYRPSPKSTDVRLRGEQHLIKKIHCITEDRDDRKCQVATGKENVV